MDCNDQKTIGYCKDCTEWYKKSELIDCGKCNYLTCQSNKITVAIGCQIVVDTPSLFGCRYFKEKPKGPFSTGHGFYGYYVGYNPTCTILGYWTTEVSAEKTCKRMNEEWAIAKGERRE